MTSMISSVMPSTTAGFTSAFGWGFGTTTRRSTQVHGGLSLQGRDRLLHRFDLLGEFGLPDAKLGHLHLEGLA